VSLSTAFFSAAETSEMLMECFHAEIIQRYILICQDSLQLSLNAKLTNRKIITNDLEIEYSLTAAAIFLLLKELV
jgi:hypothetical protein